MPLPRLIAVAGIMGSGKTTLARALAERLRFRYFPESLPALEYLTDLFRDRARWSFDTQVAFLTYKSLQLLRATRDGNDVVLDRSLYEDAEIFARHFFEKAEMDARSYETYKALPSPRARPPARPLSCALFMGPPPQGRRRVQGLPGRAGSPYPSAYLAARFTGRTSPPRPPRQGRLFQADHGVIPRGPYRSMLLRLAQQLRTLGITAFIPHRDVNRWGRRVLPADTVARGCSDGVDRCDVFIRILVMSHGSHYEFGLALGLVN